MPSIYEHIHFRKQKKGAVLFKADLAQVIANLTVATPFNDQDKLATLLRNKVYQCCQMHDQQQKLVDVYSVEIPN